LERIGQVLNGLGLKLSPEKTRIVHLASPTGRSLKRRSASPTGRSLKR
jgi:hypothetical protein